ncbi:MAG: stage II sporulation protein M [Chitinophagales bacterium]|nr:stage II sporulation protein M [Chitinophagales bacterium]
MKETKFIEQNHKKWEEFEHLSKNKEKDSALYSKLFIQITDDLSYARTFYGNRSVRVYLNNLAQSIFLKVFNRKKKKKSVFRNFWMEELPSIMYYHRKEFLISFVVVVLAILIGLLTYQHDPSFANKILGDEYLEMTAKNIAKKDPMAVYKQSNPIEMFIMIVSNNLMVDVLTFFSGLILSIGSIFVLIRNGLMLAAFQYYFIERDLFRESFLAVWLHGTLEISAMIICGAAGIVLGKGLVFPGTYSRTQAFFSSAQRATKIFFSALPITFVAGIIESFLTRYTNAPDILRLGLIVSSLLFILSYYVYLPWLKKRNGTLKNIEAEKILPENFTPFEFYKIKKISEIIIDTFKIFRKYIGNYLSILFWCTLLFTIVGATIGKLYLIENINLEYPDTYNINKLFVLNSINIFVYVFPIFFTYISTKTAYIFQLEFNLLQQAKKTVYFIEWCKINYQKIFFNLLLQVFFFIIISKFYVLFFLVPIQFIGTYILIFPTIEKTNFVNAFFQVTINGIFNLFIINLVFFLLIYSFYTLTQETSLIGIIQNAISMNFNDEVFESNQFYLIVYLITVSPIIILAYIFLTIYQGVFYFSQKEKISADGLKNQIENLGKHKKNVLQK